MLPRPPFVPNISAVRVAQGHRDICDRISARVHIQDRSPKIRYFRKNYTENQTKLGWPNRHKQICIVARLSFTYKLNKTSPNKE